MPLRLAILISGRGSNMAAIARECLERRLDAAVETVISDRPAAAGIDTARRLGIDSKIIPFQTGDRDAFEVALAAHLEARQPELVILAGFMRVLSGQLVSRYAGRMLNIHPSLLPKYPGLHTHRRALAAGDSQHGATVHFVTEQLDGGPLILQSRVPVFADDSEATLSARVQATEYRIYPQVIGWLARGRLDWNSGRPRLDGAILERPIVEDFSVA